MGSATTAEKQSQHVLTVTWWRALSHFGFQMCGLCRNIDIPGAGPTEKANWPGKRSCEPWFKSFQSSLNRSQPPDQELKDLWIKGRPAGQGPVFSSGGFIVSNTSINELQAWTCRCPDSSCPGLGTSPGQLSPPQGSQRICSNSWQISSAQSTALAHV